MENYETYYWCTKAVFKGCKSPKRKPDYQSKDSMGFASSSYWYGTDKKGSYVIRRSDHWVAYSFPLTKGAFRNNRRCKSISTCIWLFKTNKELTSLVTGKCYLNNFKKRTNVVIG